MNRDSDYTLFAILPTPESSASGPLRSVRFRDRQFLNLSICRLHIPSSADPLTRFEPDRFLGRLLDILGSWQFPVENSSRSGCWYRRVAPIMAVIIAIFFPPSPFLLKRRGSFSCSTVFSASHNPICCGAQ